MFIATTDGAFKSINAGETWENISENYFQSRILEITSSPNFANDKTIYIGTLGDFIYKSVDGGDSWVKIYHETHSDTSVHSIDISLNFSEDQSPVSYTHLTLPTNREV